ncbi:MAG: MauE/DoxX family redox-associated membrane protein [Candidatus Dependentiae bacterium]
MEHQTKKYSFKDFLPLIAIFLIVISFVGLRQLSYGPDLRAAMSDFMAAFFIIFGAFKLLNLKGFAEAYATYDVIAKKSIIYAYAYPFIEIALGLAYLFRLFPNVTNFVTLIVMFVSAIGVAIELSKGRDITCACLGVVFKIPMTYVTLFEDLLMAAMALIMLFW